MSNPFLSLDIAVLKQNSEVEIEINTDNHEIYLQKINLTYEKFQELFYPTGDNFIIDPQITKKQDNIQYTSLQPKYRKTDKGYPFNLYNSVLSNIEDDLNVTRTMFTSESLVSLTKELTSLENLSDIQAFCVDNSISWTNLLSILHNEYIKYKIHPDGLSSLMSYNISNDILNTELTVNVIFRSPNMIIKPTILRMTYNVSFPKNYIENLQI
tara:strand:- start:664 stop:1299 length:636 start_codon:yes stop_codon:yes gene_type:complete